MIKLFRGLLFSYFVSCGIGALLLVLFAFNPFSDPFSNTTLYFFALLLVWTPFNAFIFELVARARAAKIDQLRLNCDVESFIAIYKNLLRACPWRIPKTFVLLQLSAGYLTIGNDESAFQTLSQIKYFPKIREGASYLFLYHNNWFVYHVHTGDIAAAVESLAQMELALQNPKQRQLPTAYRDAYASAFIQRQYILNMAHGDYAGCEDIFTAAYENATDTLNRVSAKCTLGRIYQHENRLNEAREAFKFAAEHGGDTIYQKKATEFLEELTQ